MSTTAITSQVLKQFDDPRLTDAVWSDLLRQSDTNTVFQTRVWQQTWWECFGRGELVMILVESDGTPIALAPFFYDGGMFFLVGSGGSDYLDILGSNSPGVLQVVLETLLLYVPGALGVRLYHVPEHSRTGEHLSLAAAGVKMEYHEEGSLPAPVLDLADDRTSPPRAAQKKSLVRHERYFRSTGKLELRRLRAAEEMDANLPAFFDQHIARWGQTPFPSLFLDPKQRAFYEALALGSVDTTWLHFTRLDWNGYPIAYHFGFHYRGTYMWYKPSFDIALARRSPGEVLLRQLLIAAAEEGGHVFDFGLGDEPFKQRFATRANLVQNWGCYPRSVAT